MLIILNAIANSIGNKGITMVNATTARTLVKDPKVTLLDVRTPGEYNEGHLKNARLIPVAELAGRISELDSVKNSPILVYCRSGNRSGVASRLLKKAGFTNVSNLQGGITAWQGAGGAVTKS